MSLICRNLQREPGDFAEVEDRVYGSYCSPSGEYLAGFMEGFEVLKNSSDFVLPESLSCPIDESVHGLIESFPAAFLIVRLLIKDAVGLVAETFQLFG